MAKLKAEAAQTETRLKNLKPELMQVGEQMKLQERRITIAQNRLPKPRGSRPRV